MDVPRPSTGAIGGAVAIGAGGAAADFLRDGGAGRPSTLPAERPLDIRETPEFLAIAHRVREGLRAGHSYEET